MSLAIANKLKISVEFGEIAPLDMERIPLKHQHGTAQHQVLNCPMNIRVGALCFRQNYLKVSSGAAGGAPCKEGGKVQEG